MEHEGSVQSQKVGLVLSGGGARGAYQAGVLKAITEIRKRNNGLLPIRVLTGVSAGAINAAFMASMAQDADAASSRLVEMWQQLTPHQVFHTDAFSLGRTGMKWLTDATVGALYHKKKARSLLDTAPLARLLAERIPFAAIQRNIDTESIESVALTAMNYQTSASVSFVQGPAHLPMWTRKRRLGRRAVLGVPHTMASAALPIFFPPVFCEDGHYGDGNLRNTAPLSPAIHLGANRLIVISVRRADNRPLEASPPVGPSIARILGVMLNALLMDAIEVDMERLSRVNQTLNYVPSAVRKDLSLTKIGSIWIRPSVDIGNMAAGRFDQLPTLVRYLLSGFGSSNEAAELTSYLLFDPEFCGRLTEIGYRDALEQESELIKLLSPT